MKNAALLNYSVAHLRPPRYLFLSPSRYFEAITPGRTRESTFLLLFYLLGDIFCSEPPDPVPCAGSRLLFVTSDVRWAFGDKVAGDVRVRVCKWGFVGVFEPLLSIRFFLLPVLSLGECC